jgi:hypothetical protein
MRENRMGTVFSNSTAHREFRSEQGDKKIRNLARLRELQIKGSLVLDSSAWDRIRFSFDKKTRELVDEMLKQDQVLRIAVDSTPDLSSPDPVLNVSFIDSGLPHGSFNVKLSEIRSNVGPKTKAATA